MEQTPDFTTEHQPRPSPLKFYTRHENLEWAWVSKLHTRQTLLLLSISFINVLVIVFYDFTFTACFQYNSIIPDLCAGGLRYFIEMAHLMVYLMWISIENWRTFVSVTRWINRLVVLRLFSALRLGFVFPPSQSEVTSSLGRKSAGVDFVYHLFQVNNLCTSERPGAMEMTILFHLNFKTYANSRKYYY